MSNDNWTILCDGCCRKIADQDTEKYDVITTTGTFGQPMFFCNQGCADSY